MSEVKVFRVTGKMVKPNLKTTFRKEVRALKPEDAKEKIFMELGSKHRAKRFQIRIFKVEEVPPEEIESPLIRKLTLKDETDV
ncbi:50S ribosomal protein L18a [Candidatus Bathyarchaeota archaeon]|nr:MAG: 50S ribosomal protein L18a [Candidatus Bathyarchaeota archaeon]